MVEYKDLPEKMTCPLCKQELSRLYFTALKSNPELLICVDCKHHEAKEENKPKLSKCCNEKIVWDFTLCILKCSKCNKEAEQ